ncbi:MAG: DUF1858 domain-containing protein [Candidatus Poribacteria bacterium]
MSNTLRITGRMTVREVIQKYPDAVSIFEKHGLMGCGGKSGPVEPIAFFATVHNVDVEQLLSELNQLAEGKITIEEQGSTEVLEENLYKRFLKTAMVLLLTGGATLGAIALTNIARNTSMDYSGLWKAIVQAHGHVQFYGWVGLFIMGIAYHVLPRLGATTLSSRSLAAASYALMLVGILMRAISQPFATNPVGAVGLVVSSALELVAVFLFGYVIIKTIRSSEQKRDVFEKYIFGGVVWFGIATVAGLALAVYLVASGQNVIPSSLDAPYLHIFAIGFITTIILGISLRVLPLFMGLKSPSRAIADMSFWMLNGGIVVYSLSSLFKAQLPWLNGVYEIGVLLEVIAFAAFIINLNIFRKPLQDVAETGAWRGYEKFIHASYFWLAVAVAMFGAFGIYEAITGQSAGHALIGSYRHALTVGFISMMIFGVGARIVPVFAGVTLYSTMLLAATFVLVNLGNVIRVVFQAISPLLGDVSFVMMGTSGWLEVTGMALFCVNLWMTLRTPQEAEAEIEGLPAATYAAQAGEVLIARTTKVGDILKRYPQTLEVFLEHGFTPLKNPLMRRTVAKRTTLERACQLFSLDCDTLISELKRAAGIKDNAQNLDEIGKKASNLKIVEKPGAVVTEAEVIDALRECYDPEININVVDLGLIYDVQIANGQINVKMALTSPTCPMASKITSDVKNRLEALSGGSQANIQVVSEPPWNPDMMSEAAKKQLGWT